MTASQEALLRNLRVSVERDHRARQRRYRVAAIAIGVMLLAAATVAAATGVPWWQDAAPPVNPKVVERQLAPGALRWPASADRAHARTVAQWNGATLVAAPVSGDKGGYCLIPALSGSPDIGFSCEYQSDDEVRAYARPGSDERWIIWGRFVEPDASTVDLTPAVGDTLKVTLQPGGFFIADLPEARWSALNDGAGLARLLDASGKPLGEKCLNFGPSPANDRAGSFDTPSPLNSGACTPPPVITGHPNLSRAQQLVQATLETANRRPSTIALYKAPDTGGVATCFMIAAVPLPSDTNIVPPMQCGIGASTSSSHPVSALIRNTLVDGELHYVVTGWIDPSLDAARLELHSLGGTLKLNYEKNAFLQAIPLNGGGYLAKPVIVVYDRSGQEIARQPVP